MNLKNVRLTRGMTQKDVATAAGIARESYTNIENGVRRPSVLVAKKIADVLGIEWSELFLDEN